MTGLQGRCVYRLSSKASLRASLRLGTSGIELELGGTQRLSEFSSMGLAVSVGLQVLQGFHLRVIVSQPEICIPSSSCSIGPFSRQTTIITDSSSKGHARAGMGKLLGGHVIVMATLVLALTSQNVAAPHRGSC